MAFPTDLRQAWRRFGQSVRTRWLTRPSLVDERAPEFFVPPLCNVTALSLLILLGELVAIVLLLAGDRPSWEGFALLSLFVQWNVLVSAAALCVLRTWMAGLPLLAGAAGSFLVVPVVAIALTVVGSATVSLPNEFTWAQALSNAVVASIVGGLVLRYFFVQQQLQEQRESELRARLQALQSRIRPHFLFNSMNIIASLIASDPETAETVVEDLSQLFRASLNEAGSEVPIGVEIDLCQRYLRIEGLRLDDRLSVKWQTEGDHRDVKIPLLTLQPLLENAIYHGIQPRPEGGEIRVQVSADEHQVQVMITNPMPTMNDRIEPPAQGNRMAMNNIRSRLSVLYGTQAVLTTRESNGEYIVELRYPRVRTIANDTAMAR